MAAKRVIVVGSGGREHALAWRLSKEPHTEVFLAPGNGGSQQLGTQLGVPLPVDTASIDTFVAAVQERQIDLVVVGPEAPLVAGVVDALSAVGVAAFGPSAAAARLEGSKAFSKAFMARHGIPTADFEVFGHAEEAVEFLDAQQRADPKAAPWVVKADGLAGGKGVFVPDTVEEAKAAVQRLLVDKSLGSAGERVVLEEPLVGQEVSYHVVSDGRNYVPLAPAQDHKRAFEGDKGPNTGGMGAYSPPPVVTPDLERQIQTRVVEPTLYGMAHEGAPFRGALFVGLMICDGVAKVLEFNVRFGDPECECLMMRLGGSLLELLDGSARGNLAGYAPCWAAPAALTVVLAAQGYPGTVQKGHVIQGLGGEEARDPDVEVFHAGTTRDPDGMFRTSGGRVLAVTGRGETLAEARARTYQVAQSLQFDGMFFRNDIGHHAL